MTNTQHTPGPWVTKGPHILEEIPSFNYVASVQTSNMPEWEANARLIAAAPDLLASLERLVTLMYIVGDEPFRNGVTDSTGSIDEGVVIASDWLHAARAAIAKATGQAD